ncbi:helix-turn-helix domain-containing protein [Candidatus Woesearchaeota archaeon]|nr:helix-turn-helix domain-containing protein [Candidatus Woesearchaeota archaeon]
MISQLAGIGLTNGEARIYLALLELGPTTTGPIIDRAGISSSKVYEILERLMRKDLVSEFTKRRTRYFQASDPRNLFSLLKAQKLELETRERQLKRIIPKLESGYQQDPVSSAIIKGQEGIISFLGSLRSRSFLIFLKDESHLPLFSMRRIVRSDRSLPCTTLVADDHVIQLADDADEEEPWINVIKSKALAEQYRGYAR